MNVSRRRYMGSKGGSIPYQRIEYLESNGTQYIDTLLYGNKETAMEVDFAPITMVSSTQYSVAGSRIGGQNTNSLSIFTSNFAVTQRFDSRQTSQTLPKARCVAYIDKICFKVDGVTKVTWSTEPTEFTTPQTITVFGFYTFPRLIGRVYSFKLWQSGVLVRDFVPVRVEQVGYMYDKVSGQLFGNSGTGNFTLGPDVN